MAKLKNIPMFESFFNRSYEYSRWDGTQSIELLDADDILRALVDDYLEDGNLQHALKRLLMGGFLGADGFRVMGLRELLMRLRDQRNVQFARYNMATGVMDDLSQKLEEIKQLEREYIENSLKESVNDERRHKKQYSGSQLEKLIEQGKINPQGGDLISEDVAAVFDLNMISSHHYLDKLPLDIPGQIKGLSEYNFHNHLASKKFLELINNLQQLTIQLFFQNMLQPSQDLRPEVLAKAWDMIRDIKQVLCEKQEGNQSDFDLFMNKHGEFFPGVKSFEEIIEQIQRQYMAMQGILDNLSPRLRHELQHLIEQLIQDIPNSDDLMKLVTTLEDILMNKDIRTHYPFNGSESLPLEVAMKLMRHIQLLEILEDQIQEARRQGSPKGIDSEKVRELLGDEEFQSLERMKSLPEFLEAEGYVDGKRKLTARGIRKISQIALQDIFNKLKKDSFGDHFTASQGKGGERIDESKPYQFGDAFQLDLGKTLMNALFRVGTGTPIALQKDDFEVYRTEFTTQSSTVLMIDLSMSMIYNGCQPAAKKVAVALESLIRSQFPRDNLYVVGFSFVAREYKPEELLEMSHYDNSTGTNMVHGFMLARQLLARQHGVNKQIILITDGGPCVSFEEGEWQFGYPPNPSAEQQTLLEVQRCTREGITINTFMLEDDRWMVSFVNQLSSINHGRTFYADKNNLGEYLLVDYLNSKQKLVR